MRQDLLSGAGELAPSRHPPQEPVPDGLLQARDRARDRRLRDVQLRGRIGERPHLGGGDEEPQLSKSPVHNLIVWHRSNMH
jgi:hypothetical protein